MDNDACYAGVELGGRCSEALRCHHPEGQGMCRSAPDGAAFLTKPDRIRPPPNTPRAAATAASLHHEEPDSLPCWAQAYQVDTVRLLGEPGDTDDRMEGRPHRHRQRPGVRPSNTTLRLGFSPRPPRRSHAWTKDRTHSTSGRPTTQLQPTAPSYGPDMSYQS